MIALVSCDKNNGIGKTVEVCGKAIQTIPWKWKADMRFFKEKTWGKRILVGRKTFETLPKLKNRRILCVSRQNIDPRSWYDWQVDTAFSAITLHEAQQIALQDKSNEVFLCGGGEIYKELLPYCSECYVSRLNEDYDCDVKFPVDILKNCFESKPTRIIPIEGGVVEHYLALPF